MNTRVHLPFTWGSKSFLVSFNYILGRVTWGPRGLHFHCSPPHPLRQTIGDRKNRGFGGVFGNFLSFSYGVFCGYILCVCWVRLLVRVSGLGQPGEGS